MGYRNYGNPCVYYFDECERRWCELFRRRGYEIDFHVAEYQGRAGNYPGADIIAYKNHEIFFIEVKSGSTAEGYNVIRRLSETQQLYMEVFGGTIWPEADWIRTRYVVCTCDDYDNPRKCIELRYVNDNLQQYYFYP